MSEKITLIGNGKNWILSICSSVTTAMTKNGNNVHSFGAFFDGCFAEMLNEKSVSILCPSVTITLFAQLLRNGYEFRDCKVPNLKKETKHPIVLYKEDGAWQISTNPHFTKFKIETKSRKTKPSIESGFILGYLDDDLLYKFNHDNAHDVRKSIPTITIWLLLQGIFEANPDLSKENLLLFLEP